MATGSMAKAFEAIGSAKVTKNGEYVKYPGDYLFEVAQVKMFEGNNGVTHVTELIVREATKTDPAIDPHPPGARLSVVNVFSGPTAKVAPGKVKAFTEAIVGQELSSNDAAAAVEESRNEDPTKKGDDGKPLPVNPFKGHLVRGTTFSFTSKAGNKGYGINWSHVPGQKPKDIAARAAAQG